MLKPNTFGKRKLLRGKSYFKIPNKDCNFAV